MIIREMHISECWCPNCTNGQMEQIHDILFSEKVPLNSLIGRKITCSKCGQENAIDDVLIIAPTSYLVSSQNMASKYKSNQELNNWLNTPSE